MNMQHVLDLILDKIRRDYQDDIAIFVIMGSHLYHETHPKSDLDMYYIPKTNKGYELASVFIMEGIGFDLWPISWERIERIAKHEERLGSIVSEGQIVYYGCEEDLMKFKALQDKATDKSQTGHFIYRSKSQMRSVYQELYFLDQASMLSKARYHAVQIIYGLTYALALLNQSPIKRGRGKLLSEIQAMARIPNDFEKDYRNIFQTEKMDDLKRSVHHLVYSTQHLVDQVWYDLIQDSFTNEAQGFYEELINNYNKIERAYHINDPYTAFYAAAEIDHEIDDIIAHRGVSLDELPDLLEAYDANNLSHIYERSKEHQKKLVDILLNHGIKINYVTDLEALKAFLDRKKGE